MGHCVTAGFRVTVRKIILTTDLFNLARTYVDDGLFTQDRCKIWFAYLDSGIGCNGPSYLPYMYSSTLLVLQFSCAIAQSILVFAPASVPQPSPHRYRQF